MDNSYKRFLIRFIKPHASTMAILIALNFVSTLFSFVTPLLEKSLIDDVFIGGRTDLLVYILLGTAGTYIISSISTYISVYKKGKLDLILFNDVAKETFNSIQFASVEKIQGKKVGDLLSRVLANTRSAVSIFTHIIPGFVVNVIQMITLFSIMLFLNLYLTIIVVIPALLFLIPMLFFGKRLEDTQRVSLHKTASMYSFLKENLSMIPLIKAFGLETWSQEKFNEQMNGYYDASIDYTKNSSLNSSIDSLIYGVPMVLLVLFGGSMVVRGSMTIGTFTAFMSYVILFFGPITQFAYIWSYYKSTSPAFDRINEIFNMERDEGGEEELIMKDGIVTFDDVWFSYNNKPILQGFNATFERGLNYVIGDNGAGKSTILKLLCSLYSLDKGFIKIDGQEISRLRRTDLRKSISIIFSEPYLFDGSIYENIRIGNLSASKDEIVQAAKKVGVHEFIMDLPNRYDTQVGEGGLKLSSGEKQKISLARAILKNSPIVLLDEVTKSIDVDSRRFINEVINELKKDKTIIIVTHYLNEVERDSNKIYLNQKNRHGNHIYRSVDASMSNIASL